MRIGNYLQGTKDESVIFDQIIPEDYNSLLMQTLQVVETRQMGQMSVVLCHVLTM